jgi:hypothetical protein
MSEPERPQSQGAESEAGARTASGSLTARLVLIETSQRRFIESEGESARREEVSARLVSIEASLARPTPSQCSDGVS